MEEAELTEKTGEKAVLLLADGTRFEGTAIGKRGEAFGRVAFTTAMVGYQEALTTPANKDILLVQTFPLIGNYGVNNAGTESTETASGYIVREICEKPSNYLCNGDLESFLIQKGIVGICGIDTRRLTRHIREKGEMNGVICSGQEVDAAGLAAYTYAPKAEAPEASAIGVIGVNAEKSYRILVVNFGLTRSALLGLAGHGMLPEKVCGANSLTETVSGLDLSAYNGVFLSDGPGDPAAYSAELDGVRALAESGLPIFAVSLGHQLLALAQGMKTIPLKHGHRGANQPVLCLKNGRTYITSQNHGFAVDRDSLPDGVAVSYENANDKTVEGLSYQNLAAVSVQFLPDSQPGTQSTGYLYSEFAALMDAHKKGGK